MLVQFSGDTGVGGECLSAIYGYQCDADGIWDRGGWCVRRLSAEFDGEA